MSDTHEFGIQVDERLQLENYKAGYKAFKVMTCIGAAGALIAVLVLREDRIAFALACVFLPGLYVHEYYINKAGWEEYVHEQVAHDKRIRRRAWRSILKRGGLLCIFSFLIAFVVDEKSVPSSLIYGLLSGVISSVVYWWYEIHVAMRRKENSELKHEVSEG